MGSAADGGQCGGHYGEDFGRAVGDGEFYFYFCFSFPSSPLSMWVDGWWKGEVCSGLDRESGQGCCCCSSVGLACKAKLTVNLCLQPPITFQPPPPPGSGDNNGAAAAQNRPAAAPAQPDLITRYKLQDKLQASRDGSAGSGSSSGTEASAGAKGSGKGWSSNRDERQSLLQKRRDQMILEARRKMEAKIAAEKAAGGS